MYFFSHDSVLFSIVFQTFMFIVNEWSIVLQTYCNAYNKKKNIFDIHYYVRWKYKQVQQTNYKCLADSR